MQLCLRGKARKALSQAERTLGLPPPWKNFYDYRGNFCSCVVTHSALTLRSPHSFLGSQGVILSWLCSSLWPLLLSFLCCFLLAATPAPPKPASCLRGAPGLMHTHAHLFFSHHFFSLSTPLPYVHSFSFMAASLQTTIFSLCLPLAEGQRVSFIRH